MNIVKEDMHNFGHCKIMKNNVLTNQKNQITFVELTNKMALPIQPTPILEGKDAKRFLKAMKKREKEGMSKKDKEFIKECEEIYNITNKNGRRTIHF